MPKKQKDTDYLFISTRLRALEPRMLTRERMERMLEARSTEDAVKVLSECGYEGLDPLTSSGLEQSLRRSREETFSELTELAPDNTLVDVFRMKYDYHNIKALLKCSARGEDPLRILIDAGRISPDTLREAIQKDELDTLPDKLAEAVSTAREILDTTGDPQRSDFSLDRAYYAELSETAENSGSNFLQEYVRLLIDAANLRSAVRSIRMKKNLEFLGEVLVEGGSVDRSQISAAADPCSGFSECVRTDGSGTEIICTRSQYRRNRRFEQRRLRQEGSGRCGNAETKQRPDDWKGCHNKSNGQPGTRHEGKQHRTAVQQLDNRCRGETEPHYRPDDLPAAQNFRRSEPYH